MSGIKTGWWNSIPLLLLVFGCGLVGGLFTPNCGGADEATVAERVLGGSHELVAPDSTQPESFFAYNVRYLEDGWTAEDVEFTWRQSDGTLVQDEMSAAHVAFVLTDHHVTPRVQMVMRERLEHFCDDESKTPQELTHSCVRYVVIYCTPEQLQRVMYAN